MPLTMSREIDPLLPRGPSAPEISGYGFSKKEQPNAEVTYDTPSYYYHDAAEDAEEPTPATPSSQSALGTIVAIFTAVVFFAFVISALSPGNFEDGVPSPFPSPTHTPGHSPSMTLRERAERILDETPLIDGHNDLAILVRFAYKNQIHTPKFTSNFEDGGMEANVDLPRLHKGKVGGAFWSAFVPCPNNASLDFSDANYGEAVSSTLSQIDLLRRIQVYYPTKFTPATSSPAHALSQFHSNKSLISPISIEGLHQISQSAPMSTLRLYYALGVRAATLTWNCHNAFADAALISTRSGTTVAPYHRGGVTPLGRKVLREMNRLGMLIDLSHTSYWTQKAVLTNNTSLAPIIFSHSSAFTLCPHPRNVHDDILQLVKTTDSLVMINFSPGFISCLTPPDPDTIPEFYPKNNTLHQVARHIVYIGSLIGFDHVGLGSDFDGMENTPVGLEGVDKFPDLVAEMLRMGVSDRDAAKVVGGNLLRVWERAEEVARGMQRDVSDGGVLEGEDEVPEWKF
jgi:membrane dipeptidase